MLKMLVSIFLGITGCNLFSVLAVADEWPVIVNPPDSKVVWVGDEINQNGLPMKVKKFNSSMDINTIIGFYRSEWNDGSKLVPVENNLGNWKIIGKQVDDYYLTVQAKVSEETTSEGFLSVSKLPVYSGPELDVNFPVLSGSDLLSRTSSGDIGRAGETLVFRNSFSIQSNASFYESEMKASGWDMTRNDTNPVSDGIAKFLYFQRSKHACSIVISSSERGDTMIIVNKVKY